MKKLRLIFAFLLVAGCSADDENSAQINESIFGKWYHKEIIINDIIFPYDDHEPCGKDFIEFYEENKIKSIDVWECEEDLIWIGTFIMSNSNLTISNGSESLTVEIIELNSISLAYQYYFDDNNDGINELHIEKFTRN